MGMSFNIVYKIQTLVTKDIWRDFNFADGHSRHEGSSLVLLIGLDFSPYYSIPQYSQVSLCFF